jgi:hypothetical protein
MAKKSKLARYKKKRKAKARSNPETKQAIELATNVGAGFAGYAATRLLSRMAYATALKRFPKGSPYIHIAASALSATGVYFGSKHWSKVDEYHEAASIGAGIAVMQTALQTLAPKLGWIVSDVSADQYVAKAKRELPAADMTSILPAAEAHDALPQGDFGDFDLDALLSEDDSIEAVPIGQAPSTETPEEIADNHMFGGGDDPLEHYNGMMN